MTNSTTPYRDYAEAYLASGLGYPIPSAYPFEKHPPLSGWTGRKGAIPTMGHIEAWQEHMPESNILIRMAPDVIGIDVDDYDDKHGIETMQVINGTHGSLPPTAISSAREMPSGIHWYRLRPWMETDRMRDPGTHVEVIRYEHRYAVAPPSWHSGARARYRWNRDAIPQVNDLPYITAEWYVHLTRGCSCFAQERAAHRMEMQRMMTRQSGQAGYEAARKDLDQAVNALLASSTGERNNLLSRIAGRFMLYDVVMNGVLDAPTVAQLLHKAGVEAGLEDEETRRTIRSAMEWAQREGDSRE